MPKSSRSAAVVWLTLLPSLAYADGSVTAPPSAAARLVPADLMSLIAIDIAQLRAAGPRETMTMLMEGLRPKLARIGASPEKVGQLVLGTSAGAGSTARPPMVIIADLPLDAKRLEKEIGEGPWTGANYQGVKLRRGARNSYAILPGDRLVLTDGMKLERVIDLAQGRGNALVDKGAEKLLRRVGVTGGQGPTVFGWVRLDAMKATIEQTAPAAAGVEEAAGSLTTGATGADVKLIGRCLSAKAAATTAEAARSMIKSTAGNSTVAMLGLTPLVNAVKVDTSEDLVTLSLHMTATQYTDLIMRMTGFVQSSLSATSGAPSVPESDESQVRPKPKKKPAKN